MLISSLTAPWIPAVSGGKILSMAEYCEHVSTIAKVTPSADGCEDCLKIGSSWVHLRLCEICGHVGCCDSSPNQHATKHFNAVGHPIIRSFEPEEVWGYCYVDDMFYDSLPNV